MGSRRSGERRPLRVDKVVGHPRRGDGSVAAVARTSPRSHISGAARRRLRGLAGKQTWQRDGRNGAQVLFRRRSLDRAMVACAMAERSSLMLLISCEDCDYSAGITLPERYSRDLADLGEDGLIVRLAAYRAQLRDTVSYACPRGADHTLIWEKIAAVGPHAVS